MISKFNLLNKYLNLLLVFLFPTQLALHFWPDFAFIFGIRVDYLSPTIYLTDVLFILLFVPWVFNSKQKVLNDLKRNWRLLIFLLLTIIINLTFSTSITISAVKWAKILELICLGFYIQQRRDVFTFKNISLTLFYSLIFFSIIGTFQFIRGKTFENIFYLVGERNFSIFTPGIALVNLFGNNFLRVYSTFPHPNSLAGYVGASLLFIIFNNLSVNKLVKFLGYVIILFAFIFSFSLSAYVGVSICLVIYLLSKKIKIYKLSKTFIIIVFLLSLTLLVFSKTLVNSRINFSQSFQQRLELANTSGKIISDNWLVGSGLNTFVVNETAYDGSDKSVWLLQPVHNIYLLIFAETGIIGMSLLYILLFTLSKKISESKNDWGFLILIFILTTGMFDHYWFTIQQNLLLLALFCGLTLRENR